jgi:hypothetical protein
MMNYAVDYLPVIFVIVPAGLVIYGFLKFVNYTLPGDRERLSLLKQIRDMEELYHQQSRQIIDNLIDANQ